MKDFGERFPVDAKPVCGLLDGEPLANDEADAGPIQGGFGPSVVLVLHVPSRPSPGIRGHARRMLRAIRDQLNRHLY